MGKDITVAEGARSAPVVDGPTGQPEAALLTVDDAVTAGAEVLAVENRTGVVRRGQRGMVSAEWAVGIVAAISIAGVLLAVITNGQVQQALLKFVLWVIETFVSVVS